MSTDNLGRDHRPRPPASCHLPVTMVLRVPRTTGVRMSVLGSLARYRAIRRSVRASFVIRWYSVVLGGTIPR
jgi:hypothetical protein